jgi:hypothetical protein
MRLECPHCNAEFPTNLRFEEPLMALTYWQVAGEGWELVQDEPVGFGSSFFRCTVCMRVVQDWCNEGFNLSDLLDMSPANGGAQ